jgi:hypothetical protein
MSRLLYVFFVFLVTCFCFRHTHTHTHTHTHILYKEKSHVANIRTFHISGTYILFSYLLSGANGTMTLKFWTFHLWFSCWRCDPSLYFCPQFPGKMAACCTSPRCSFMRSIARLFRKCRLFIWVSMLLANITWALIPATFRRAQKTVRGHLLELRETSEVAHSWSAVSSPLSFIFSLYYCAPFCGSIFSHQIAHLISSCRI